jgi:transcriptional regulator with XRE-family HTH domain
VANLERPFDRGTRRGLRVLRTLGEECREQRVGLGLSQQAVADAARITRPRYSDFERAKIANLSVVEASVITAVLGLDISVRTYPGGPPLRDAGQAEDLVRFLRHVRAPLRYRTDVPLPQRPDSPTELRAWDVVILGKGIRTAVEFEKRIRDAQAMTRRHEMKRRDDPVDGFVHVLADTRTNRRVDAQYRDLWPDLPKLRTSRALAMLEVGEHPPGGIIFI